MKRIMVIIFMLFFIQCLAAQTGKVKEADARKAAKKFFYERISQYHNIHFEDITLSQGMEIRHDGETVYYTFNVEPEGFIIVSAWYEAFPFLAYSFEGRYDPSWQPENFSAWMGQYARQIHHAATSGTPAARHASEAWEYYLETAPEALQPFSGREVEPLLTSTWDQGKFYNEMCPADPSGPGGHCYAGCVATAMGQVMNYFRWPDTGTGTYSYSCPPYGTLSANFDSTAYRWDLMETGLSHSNLFLAELLYHLGVSVDMVYGPDGSGMYNHKAAYSLRTYFKYSPETQYVYRDSTAMDWDSLLVAHLDQAIPMYYAGWSVPNINGHAFVCDGYQDSAYYHFNWGWGGSYDGYFYTDNLTPGGSNFNLAQELIIHAVPDTVSYTYPLYCQGEQEYETLYGTLEDGSGPLYTYPGQSDCQWLITPADTIDGLNIDVMTLDLGQGDTLRVYDGGDAGGTLLAVFTSSSQPQTVQTEGSMMYVTFQSDANSNGGGFLAEFSSEIPVFCSGNTMLTAQADTISDGSGSWDYHNNSQCIWMISPPGASEVTLFFENFATEENFDFLRVYDLESQDLLAEISGYYDPGTLEPVTSPSGKMFMVFVTNYTNRAPGWTVHYMTDLVGTPENFKGPGTINIYPNPSSGTFNVELNGNFEGYTLLQVQDIYGRAILQQEIEAGQGTIRISAADLSAGIYNLTLKGKRVAGISKKIIVN